MFNKYLTKRRLAGEKVEFKLYSKEEIKKDFSKRNVKMTPFLIGENAPCVIVCPGGAYEFISLMNEGVEIALKLNESGYNAFVLSYSVGRKAHFPAPMRDLARCICMVKENPDNKNVNTNSIHIMGSSAGGHLCSYFESKYEQLENYYHGKKYSLRPNSVVLSYPVITMGEDTHDFSRFRLLGLNPSEKEKLARSSELLVTEDTPPTFLWHCEDDDCVPISNSIRFDKALTEKGVEHVFKTYKTGGHGIGIAWDKEPYGWIDEAIEFMQKHN